MIEVRDDGAGMEAETLRRAVAPFFTTRPGGTGLGLAIVERVAAAHGGAVNLTSAPGKGTTVQIWLPASVEDGDE
ncbi:MAG: ATP-binding protein [Planctomycetota bacterium]